MVESIPIPENEAARLERLRQYQILDTPPAEAFDRVTRLASRLLKAPIALVSLVDEDRQWFKSKVGLDADQTPREMAFCAHAICDSQVMVVPNATQDPRFANNPLVTGAPSIRFYAGVPLNAGNGENMGTLCVIDSSPREFSEEDRLLLNDLAHIVIDELELHALVIREQEARNRLLDAIEAAPDGFVYYDRSDRLAQCNERYRELYKETADLLEPGIHFEEALRTGVERGQYPDAEGNEEAWIQRRLALHRNPQGPVEQQLPNGRWLRIEERRTRDGGLVGFRTDITELKNRESELERLATTDPLTGALNRRRFIEAGESELRRARRYATPLSLLLCDVDHFKRVNDTYGHAAGDMVLRQLVRAAKVTLREHDLVCRFGGEEFAILLPQTEAAAAEVTAERLRKIVEQLEIESNEARIRTSISIGVTQVDANQDSLESALSRADTALYQAKKAGRNRITYLDPEIEPLSVAL